MLIQITIKFKVVKINCEQYNTSKYDCDNQTYCSKATNGTWVDNACDYINCADQQKVCQLTAEGRPSCVDPC